MAGAGYDHLDGVQRNIWPRIIMHQYFQPTALQRLNAGANVLGDVGVYGGPGGWGSQCSVRVTKLPASARSKVVQSNRSSEFRLLKQHSTVR